MPSPPPVQVSVAFNKTHQEFEKNQAIFKLGDEGQCEMQQPMVSGCCPLLEDRSSHSGQQPETKIQNFVIQDCDSMTHPCAAMYLIASGSVDVVIEGRKTVATLSSGHVFGEMALVDEAFMKDDHGEPILAASSMDLLASNIRNATMLCKVRAGQTAAAAAFPW